MADSDDDATQLSAQALAALQEFYQEQSNLEENMTGTLEGDVEKFNPKEDWQLSQFWSDDATAERLTREALAVVGENGRIACVSCPTTYKKIRELKGDGVQAFCLEYDERFKVFGEHFVFYDYNEPLRLPVEFKNSFDLVLVDPPFLSEECLSKVAITVQYLTKDKVLLCTGAVMAEAADRLLGVKLTKFVPTHTHQLQNEFRCYTNYDSFDLDKND
ncbi:EEF1A lysine methyltransferase 1-like isoform X1 [Littorina saxatilis]|uniref:Protein-lysine N-methyltransferase V1264_015693 n=2 Tax=Littorina saxatilis TaxID=31220 RepID=A0AAN9BM99_9CAEN